MLVTLEDIRKVHKIVSNDRNKQPRGLEPVVFILREHILEKDTFKVIVAFVVIRRPSKFSSSSYSLVCLPLSERHWTSLPRHEMSPHFRRANDLMSGSPLISNSYDLAT